jgi:DNA topoisomerase-1
VKLIIVESPAKARTIARFLGPGYKVAASYGHIRDLPGSAREIPARYRQQSWARLGVDTEGGFQPLYVVSPESRQHVRELKGLVAQADEVILATDEDREGEAISWHLLEVLRPKVPVRRIAFHEITRSAVEHALSLPRELDRQLVRAQESRRILDRLYGYSLSPVLWKRVRTKLSAGRVQSVAVRLIVEREEERRAFRISEYWDVEAALRGGDCPFAARLISVGSQRVAGGKDFDGTTGRLKAPAEVLRLTQQDAERIAAGALANQPWRVSRLERREVRQRPQPPFITSTLQQAASGRLGFSPRRTMRVAQRLYEGVDLGGSSREGLITYMRTDSLTLSEKALQEAEAVIRREFGPQYTSGPRRYRTKVKSAQEAHEAIRPTEVGRPPAAVAPYLDPAELALYELIWRRTLASQMSDAVLDKTTADLAVTIAAETHVFRATGSVVRFAGFLAVSGGAQQDTLLPALSEGLSIGESAEAGDAQAARRRPADNPPMAGSTSAAPCGDAAGVRIESVQPRRHETTPPARYSEATLVRKLEEEGIGRPSTYAPIISTIQQRGYVVKKNNSLLPTYVGMAVTHLLRVHFARYVDIGFTAQMEEDLDRIARGEIDWREFLQRFYGGEDGDHDGLRDRIEQELPAIDYPRIPVGEDPRTGQRITARIGRNYVFVQLGDEEDGRRATIPLDLLIDDLTAEKARDLIGQSERSEQPLGQDEQTGQNIYVRIGPYGPYLQLGEVSEGHKPKRVGLPKGTRPEDITVGQARRLLSLPRRLGTDPESGEEVTAGLGRYGPYVARGRTFAGVDTLEDLFTITLPAALERIRQKRRRGGKTLLAELGEDPRTGRPIEVLRGRYGPYVTDGEVNARLTNRDPHELTLQDAVGMLEEAASRPASQRGRSRKKAAKKTAKKSLKKATRKVGRKATGKVPSRAGKKVVKRTGHESGKKAGESADRGGRTSRRPAQQRDDDPSRGGSEKP